MAKETIYEIEYPEGDSVEGWVEDNMIHINVVDTTDHENLGGMVSLMRQEALDLAAAIIKHYGEGMQ